LSPQKFLSLLMIGVAMLVSAGSVQSAPDFASPLFAQRWQQDEHVAPNFWGPLADAHPGQDEPYGGGDACRPPRQCPASIPDGSAMGHRLVQYFDKGRMELNGGGQGTIVTSGLLVHELITGQLQVGDTQFQALAPAAVSVAGDSTNAFPLYRDLGNGAAVSTMAPVGTPVTLLLTPHGSSTIPQPPDAQTVVSLIDTQTGHGVPTAFADFRARVGVQNVGLALTDPFWADVQVAGTTRRVLIQAYERRVLTYNPANPAPFQVEFGNVGQQYYRWRYGTTATAAPPATDPVSPPIAPAPPGGTRMVTLADDGQAIAVFRGTSFVLSLGSDVDWHVQIADEAIVSRDPSATPPTDSQGVYIAKQAGQTTLTATGNPTCYNAVPRCLAPSQRYQVEIIVKQLPRICSGSRGRFAEHRSTHALSDDRLWQVCEQVTTGRTCCTTPTSFAE